MHILLSQELLLLQNQIMIYKKNIKKLAFKNNAPFISCISKTINTLIDNAEDLDIVVLMYNLLKYNKSFSNASGSLWNYEVSQTEVNQTVVYENIM